MKPLRIVIACGGTGGHLFPGIAVAQAARARGHDSLVLISEKQIDALATEGHEDLNFRKLPSIAMPRVLSLKFPGFLYRLWKSIRTCRQLLKEYRADVVLGMGGFTSLAPIYAGRKAKLKTLLHESNAIPGKSNRRAAKYCDLVLLGLEDCAPHFPPGKTRVVGTPLREALRAEGSAAEAYEFFKLSPDKFTLLIMGGSQGARGLNECVVASLSSLDAARLQIIHLTGPTEIDAMTKAYQASPIQVHVAPFCQRMELAYRISSAAVSRAGASSLTELSAFGIPTILIPYPSAADDHQTKNGDVFVREKAAIMVQERDLTGNRLGGLINELLTKDEVRREMGARMLALGKRDAAERVCSAIEELATV